MCVCVDIYTNKAVKDRVCALCNSRRPCAHIHIEHKGNAAFRSYAMDGSASKNAGQRIDLRVGSALSKPFSFPGPAVVCH